MAVECSSPGFSLYYLELLQVQLVGLGRGKEKKVRGLMVYGEICYYVAFVVRAEC